MCFERFSESQIEAVVSCEKKIGYVFKDKSLLLAALTHASGANDRLESNERLEFLGDSILGFVICELLYKRYPELLEGELTQIKSAVVSRSTCAKIGLEMGLVDCLLLGKGVNTGEGLPNSLVANALESIIAAVYMDGGLQVARDFIVENSIELVEAIEAGQVETNYKSALQQIAQRKFGNPPSYHLIDETGPDHNKRFEVCAQVGKQRFSSAWGATKKQAEQFAAGNALAEMTGDQPPFLDDVVATHA